MSAHGNTCETTNLLNTKHSGVCGQEMNAPVTNNWSQWSNAARTAKEGHGTLNTVSVRRNCETALDDAACSADQFGVATRGYGSCFSAVKVGRTVS
jgi:hypothetical protein